MHSYKKDFSLDRNLVHNVSPLKQTLTAKKDSFKLQQPERLPAASQTK